jgi:hypothetical protein
LRTAGGQVRCGRCGNVFNALARLAEEPGAFAVGESALELEARADDILRATPQASVPRVDEDPDMDFASPPDELLVETPGKDVARLQVLDWRDEELPQIPSNEDEASPRGRVPSDGSASMEFTLPPGELDRIFIEDKHRASRTRADDSPPVGAHDAALDPESGIDVDIDLGGDGNGNTGSGGDSDGSSDGAGGSATGHGGHDIYGDNGFSDLRRDLRGRASGSANLTAANLTAANLAATNLAGFDIAEPATRSLALVFWTGAAVLGALLLGAQMVHQNREWLAAREPFGVAVRSLYANLGHPLPAPANLSAYQLRQWGVTGDPGANGKLRVRASILNTAGLFQPYPLLRVTLANRFGNRIGARDFEPAEYLGRPTVRLLAPGERVDATIDIVDPGNDAEGFEIDVCTRGADQRIVCANDLSAHAH